MESFRGKVTFITKTNAAETCQVNANLPQYIKFIQKKKTMFGNKVRKTKELRKKAHIQNFETDMVQVTKVTKTYMAGSDSNIISQKDHQYNFTFWNDKKLNAKIDKELASWNEERMKKDNDASKPEIKHSGKRMLEEKSVLTGASSSGEWIIKKDEDTSRPEIKYSRKRALEDKFVRTDKSLGKHRIITLQMDAETTIKLPESEIPDLFRNLQPGDNIMALGLRLYKKVMDIGKPQAQKAVELLDDHVAEMLAEGNDEIEAELDAENERVKEPSIDIEQAKRISHFDPSITNIAIGSGQIQLDEFDNESINSDEDDDIPLDQVVQTSSGNAEPLTQKKHLINQ